MNLRFFNNLSMKWATVVPAGYGWTIRTYILQSVYNYEFLQYPIKDTLNINMQVNTAWANLKQLLLT